MLADLGADLSKVHFEKVAQKSFIKNLQFIPDNTHRLEKKFEREIQLFQAI